METWIERIAGVNVSDFLMLYSIWSWISDAESGNLNSSFHVGAVFLVYCSYTVSLYFSTCNE